MIPCAYPKRRHTRAESPQAWKTYQRYKSTLRREFRNRCVYCRRPDKLWCNSFGVDHYRPKKKFPTLSTTYSNLFYCCNSCNSHKGEFWPTDSEFNAGYFIPNPCDHVMFDHLRFKKSTILPRTDAGRCAVEVLWLNDETEIEFRNGIIRIIGGLIESKKRLAETLKEIEKRLTEGESLDKETFLHKQKVIEREELSKTKLLIRDLCAIA